MTRTAPSAASMRSALPRSLSCGIFTFASVSRTRYFEEMSWRKAAAGTVINASIGWNGGFGNVVMVMHPSGYTTIYAHLSSIAVVTGQSVAQGQVVGYVGSTGNSTGSHLHFEVHDMYGTPVDPLAFSYP